MAHLIDKDALVAKIERRIKINKECMLGLRNLDYYQGKVDALNDTISFIDTLKVKEVESELIVGWFEHIAQMADDRKTLNGEVMEDWAALDEIKCLAKNSADFIQRHYKAQKGE